jgi:hypothetical protein
VENTGVHQFELLDARGQPHQYLVTEHPAGEGMAVMFELLAVGAPTVLGLAGAALKSEELLGAVLAALSDDTAELATSELGKMLAGLDLAAAGAELGRALGTGKAPELTRRILSRTIRDGQPVAKVLDLAYQANYGELLLAVWRVCAINRFFPVPSTSGSEPKAANALAGG